MSLSKEQLLQKRVICTGHEDNHYPGSEYLPGEILYEHTLEKARWYDRLPGKEDRRILDGTIRCSVVDNPPPHLFRVLQWWEIRADDDLPIYYRRKEFKGDFNIVFKADQVQSIGASIPGAAYGDYWHSFEMLKIATKEEYEAYLITLPPVFSPGQQAE